MFLMFFFKVLILFYFDIFYVQKVAKDKLIDGKGVEEPNWKKKKVPHQKRRKSQECISQHKMCSRQAVASGQSGIKIWKRAQLSKENDYALQLSLVA